MFCLRHATVLMLVTLLFSPTAALAQGAQRIISLGGSVTEIAVALGAGERLIGRDTTSNHPPQITSLPDVGYIRALSPEGVLSLAPDLIISERGAGPAEALDVLRAANVRFVEMPGEPSAQGVLDKIDAVAAALELPEAGKRLHEETAARLQQVQTRAREITAPKPVLFILTLQSERIIAGGSGSSADGIIRLAGGILIMAHGPDSPGKVDQVLAHPILGQTPAAKSGKVLHVDAMQMLGFGPRTPEAAQILQDALYGAAE
jgi:iron complex transport system substrate-binding protein